MAFIHIYAFKIFLKGFDATHSSFICKMKTFKLLFCYCDIIGRCFPEPLVCDAIIAYRRIPHTLIVTVGHFPIRWGNGANLVDITIICGRHHALRKGIYVPNDIPIPIFYCKVGKDIDITFNCEGCTPILHGHIECRPSHICFLTHTTSIGFTDP